ncbi:uncharacterized protein [Hemitrygon akajei]|uniref:uncharacterized protein isoform X1 n=1 Tax=Hemitrygon akajei TaxID=2704970 RepID=UPI003BFA113F
MEMAGLQNVDSPQTDGANFDPVRQRVWQALRKLYPPRVDPKALKRELLGDTENPAAYVENQLKKWRLETEQEVENNLFLNSLFRQSILDAMPPQVKSKLEEVVGLSSLTPQAFSDHVVHAVEKYRRDKRKLAEQQEEVLRKLLQMQLEELKKKDKDKSKKMLPAITSRFINYTDDALEALGQQLDATSRMAWQNRQVLDWLLAEKGCVCVMFGDQCCTFIPNNTSPEGSFTRAMNKLKDLRKEVKQNAGFGHQWFDWLESKLGGWGAWLIKLAMTAGIVLISCAFILCCFFSMSQDFDNACDSKTIPDAPGNC